MSAEVMNDVSTVEKKIESIVFKILKDKIKGRIFVKMEDKAEGEVDTLYIKIESNNLIYTEYLQLPGNTFNPRVLAKSSFVDTISKVLPGNCKYSV